LTAFGVDVPDVVVLCRRNRIRATASSVVILRASGLDALRRSSEHASHVVLLFATAAKFGLVVLKAVHDRDREYRRGTATGR
jgi:hypothetical protein